MHFTCLVLTFTDVNREETEMVKQEVAADVQNDKKHEADDTLMSSESEVKPSVSEDVTVSNAVQFADGRDIDDVKLETDALKAQDGDAGVAASEVTVSVDKPDKTLCRRLCHTWLTLVGGWRTYARQTVFFAGLSLAMLYMTVLGYDSITVGKSVGLFYVFICTQLCTLCLHIVLQ